MSIASPRRPPFVRMLIYLVIVGICGGVAAWELGWWLGSNTTSATVLSVSRPTRRSTFLRAEYEYLDEDQVRHLGTAYVHPTTNPLDPIEIQYLRLAPDSSRLTSSPAAGLCYGSVALLAAVVFVGEIVTRRRRRSSPE